MGHHPYFIESLLILLQTHSQMDRVTTICKNFLFFRDRFIRVQLAGYMWDLGYFIAQPLGAWLYNIGGFVLNFGTAVGIYLVACFIGLIKLWGFKENTNEYDLTVKGIKESFLNLVSSKVIFRVIVSNEPRGISQSNI